MPLPELEIVCPEGQVPTNNFYDIENDKGEVTGLLCIPNYGYRRKDGLPIERPDYSIEVIERDEKGKATKYIWSTKK